LSAHEDAVAATLAQLERRLLAARVPAGHWVGELSASALSTATAVGALSLAGRAASDPLLAGGRRWLAQHRNADGGWGDTIGSRSNVATTALGWAALGFAGAHSPEEQQAEADAAGWLRRQAGGLDAASLARALAERYGADRTFSAPILTFLTISGRLGPEAWRHVAQLPFELALVPSRFLGAVRLPVVSYALPALIAIGQVRHHHRPTRNPLARLARAAAREPSLRILHGMQPESGGYLEAVPLTSFVVSSLIAAGRGGLPVVERGLAFLAATQRPDGSWPIDSDLACWVTTLSIAALGSKTVREAEPLGLRQWLLRAQHKVLHPYTRAAPGGWAWTDRSGGVPDADDTAGALLALSVLDGQDPSIDAGIDWLLGLQNRDGGIPTFCRGWGALPFDRSSPDITAHAVRAWLAWRPQVTAARGAAIDRAFTRALRYLASAQRADGSWVPLWFGNEAAPGEENPTYGTARVLPALRAGGPGSPFDRGRGWLLGAQNADGGWGGAPGVGSSLEETGLALAALAGSPDEATVAAVRRGIAWIVDRTEGGKLTPAAPIGLYFARLWYAEALYPLIFALEGLRSTLAVDSRRSWSATSRP
jgi:squalene-hopene/tetraprenyl-beta-curcumene cyclase